MKTLHKIAIVAALMLPIVARAGIVGTPHDFSGETWNVSTSDPNSVCGPCHQPHHADSTVIPLWAHASSSAAYTMYNSVNVPVSDLQSTPSASPTGPSKACLSCHDGTVAINNYGGSIQGGAGVTITNRANLGTDLTGHHPISLDYTTAITGIGAGKDQWLNDPATTTVLQPDSGTFVVENDMTIKGFLLNGKDRLECTSCHDVHNQGGSPYSITSNSKLVKIMGTQGGKGSLLCRSCHNK